MSAKDDAWFEQLYQRHAPAVLAYARRRTPADAEDVLVEVFEVAWRRRDRVPPEPLPWLYATAGNVIAHTLRGDTRRGRLMAKVAAQPVVPATEEHDRLATAMLTLSADDQEILRLWAWEDLDGAALAQALGCAPGAARTRLHRAKTRLRTAMTNRAEGTA